jgi:hypothetical protein
LSGWATRARFAPGVTSAHFDRELLEDAVDACPNGERLLLAHSQIVERLELLDRRPLRLDLRFHRLGRDMESLLFEIVARRELLRPHFGALENEIADELLRVELLVRLGLELRLRVERSHSGGDRLLVQDLTLETDPQVGELRLLRPKLVRRVSKLLLELGIAELEDDGLGLHIDARQEDAALDASARPCRHPSNRLGHDDERSRAAHLADHLTPLHRVHPHGGPVDRRCRRLESGKPEADGRDPGENRPRDDGGANPLLAGHALPYYVQRGPSWIARRKLRPRLYIMRK